MPDVILFAGYQSSAIEGTPLLMFVLYGNFFPFLSVKVPQEFLELQGKYYHDNQCV